MVSFNHPGVPARGYMFQCGIPTRAETQRNMHSTMHMLMCNFERTLGMIEQWCRRQNAQASPSAADLQYGTAEYFERSDVTAAHQAGWTGHCVRCYVFDAEVWNQIV